MLDARQVSRVWRILLLVSVVGFVGGCSRAPVAVPEAPVTLENLLARMTDIGVMSERPLGKSFLVSSYDRNGGNMDWAVWRQAGSNGRIVLLDVAGPGYVSRIWIASFAAQRWLFFFDGESSPRLALTQRQLFGDDPAFPFLPPLAGNSGGGRYSLMPIPFARQLRIEVEPLRLDPADRNYFHINYTLADNPTCAAESWPPRLSPAQSNAVTLARATLDADAGQLRALGERCLADQTPTELAPGASIPIVSARGGGRLEGFAIRIVAPAPAGQLQHAVLRNLRLRAWWDGAKAPSVDVPLGDFFCNPFYMRRFAAFGLGRVGDAYVCRLPMPYRRQARVTVENRGQSPVTVVVGARAVPASKPGRRRYFHANWSASSTSGQFFEMAVCKGPGHYIGCFMTAIGQDGSWNILEGDEHLLPDAGIQPPQYGTGLEDYFNGAYYYTSLFDLPQHGLIEKGAMRTDQYRYHSIDAIDFDRDFTARIEFGDQNRAQGYMSSVVYWYGDEPQDCTLNDAQAAKLARPADRFELPGLMAMLFTLEREALWEEAGVRCEYLALKYRQQPWADLLRVRAAAYREHADGLDAARGDFERLAHSKFAPAAGQAGDQLWRHAAETHALLGMHMRGQYTLWIDGIKVSTGNSRAVLQVIRLDIKPGPHTWEVDFTPTLQGSFFSLCLRTQWGDITSAGTWETVDVDPLPGRAVPEVFKGGAVLPNMTVWQFEPNGYINMQSGPQGVTTWAFWDGKPMVKRIRLRQTWTNGPAVRAASPVAGDIPERTKEELRAHAID
jgi:hypothetical protein